LFVAGYYRSVPVGFGLPTYLVALYVSLLLQLSVAVCVAAHCLSARTALRRAVARLIIDAALLMRPL